MDTIEINIKSNAPQVEKETTSLRQQVKELRKEMEACEVGSDEYNDALIRLAQTSHDLREQQEAVKNSAGDLGTALNNVQQVGTGIVAGFSSVNAIMALTGGQSENLQKAMVKLQAGMALVQGLKGMEGMGKKMKALVVSFKSMFTATKTQTTANKALATSENTVSVATKGVSTAMNGLKAAIIATGIGALVVLLGTLIANLDKVGKWLGITKEQTNEYENANENLNNTFDKQNKELDREITLLQASGASTQTVIKKKKELREAQLAETLATIKNIEARNAQLEADKRWWKFWQNNGSQIKANNEELKKLNETVEVLQNSIKDLDTEAQADIIKSSREAGKKAAEQAKKAAEDYKKTLKDVQNSAEKTFEAIAKSYKETIQNLGKIEFSITSDIDVWKTIQDYFNDPTAPNNLKKKLAGIADGIASYAKDALTKSFYEQIAAIDVDKVTEDLAKRLGKDVSQVTTAEIDAELNARKEKIAREYYNTLSDIFSNLPSFEDYFAGQFDLVPQFTTILTPYIEAAKAIPEQFTETFTALQKAYDDGLIDYDEFYSTLLGIQRTYNTKLEEYKTTALENLKNDYEKQIITTEEYENALVEIKYAYSIKPLSFQKTVGEKFLAELDKQNKRLETNSARFWDIYNISLMQQLQKAAESWDLYSAGTFKQRYESAQYELDFQKTVYDQEYQAKVEHINNLLSLNTLTVEQEAALRDQLEQLNREKLQNDIDYYTESAANRDEYYAGLQEAVTQGIEAFGDLTNNLANVFTAAAEEMKDADGNYTEEGKKMLETSAALQIATATMTAAAGIATVWATSAQLGPIAGPIVAAIQTAAHIANLVVQIMSIKKALAQGLAGSTSGSGTSAVEPPDTSFTLQSADAYQTTLSDETQTDLQANAKNNQRVYVVSSDITDSQNENKTTVTTATF